jgi:hypothetical protein
MSSEIARISAETAESVPTFPNVLRDIQQRIDSGSTTSVLDHLGSKIMAALSVYETPRVEIHGPLKEPLAAYEAAKNRSAILTAGVSIVGRSTSSCKSITEGTGG